MKKLIIIILVVFCIVQPLSAQQRGGVNEEGIVEIIDARPGLATGKQWAVFIAIDEYTEWGKLDYPVKDAQDIKRILLDHYYIDEIMELYNKDATLTAIRQLFVELGEKTGPNDSVFIFHAGHGINEEKTDTPAWIPYNGSKNIYTQGWMLHSEIRSRLDSFNAKHVFLISDSCYSGNLLIKTRGMPGSIINYPAAYDKKSRQVMSSGGNDTVHDISKFAEKLRSIFLEFKRPYLTPSYLFSQIMEEHQISPLNTTEPMFAPFPESQHQSGGSFLFFRKNPTEPALPEETVVVTEDDRLPPLDSPPPPPERKQGEQSFFVGKWITTVEINNSFDDIEITLQANGRCTVKVTNDNAQQETTGNWSFEPDPNDNKYFIFILNATFRNPTIAYMRNINWTARGTYGGGSNSFHFNVRAIPSAPIRQIVFFRND